ncbi:MAG: hypothetical protein ABIG55_00615 [Candidatus Omnitrophota bacterium]|nr:hypothetical protein [Candidatus Omnitrophota bacterium]
MKPVKRYIQACDMGGSIYGRTRSGADKNRSVPGHKGKGKDLIGEYSRFYKSQVGIIGRALSGGH